MFNLISDYFALDFTFQENLLIILLLTLLFLKTFFPIILPIFCKNNKLNILIIFIYFFWFC